MSHLLWKFYWENDVDKFRRLLAPTGYGAQSISKSPGIGVGGFAPSPGALSKSRKASGHGTSFGASKGGGAALGKAEVNSRDYVGLTVLLRAAASTDRNAVHFVEALLDHPALDLYAQDPESGWNALHRALYAGNVSIARVLMEKERRTLAGESFGSDISRVGLLIKTKDHEGNSPFDLYNTVIGIRDIRAEKDPSESGDDSNSESSSTRAADRNFSSLQNASGDENSAIGEELYVFGSNRNLNLGVGDEDDRHFPERILLKRPDHLLLRFYEEYLQRVKNKDMPDEVSLEDIPILIRSRPIIIQDVVLSKFHSAVLTTDPVSNLYVCGVGRGGRLGLGNENTQFRFVPVQSGLADKKIAEVALGQNHTMAVTSEGELWTWGSNSNSQLGYVLPPPPKKDEEPMTSTPRQVFGPLKKEVVLGVAASSIHSVAHTGASIFCWGRNVGQLGLMDSDSRSQEVQPIPRKVAASLFSSTIIMVSAIDKATTCLLANRTVCVFTSYGYNMVRFPHVALFINLPDISELAAFGKWASNAVDYITSGGETIAAMTSRGDVYTMSLNQKADDRSPVSSTTNPAKIKGAVTKPQLIWTARKDGVASVGVSENGSVIICTESGAVWRRIKRTKVKDGIISWAGDSKRKDFKFQRVPSITKAVAVRSSAFGTFAAIRKDSDVVKEQIKIDARTLWQDIAPLLPLQDFLDRRSDKAGDQLSSGILKPQLKELLKSADFEGDLHQHLQMTSSRYEDLDMEISTTEESAPALWIPAHSWVLAARSSIIRAALVACLKAKSHEVPDVFRVERHGKKFSLTFVGLDVFSLLNIVAYAYQDITLPVWNCTREAPQLASRFRNVRVELMKTAPKLNMMGLEAAARMQVAPAKSLDKDLHQAVRTKSFFETGDVTLELNEFEIRVHSELLCQRCPYFKGLFQGRSQGQWLAGRRNADDPSDTVRIDFKHMDPEAFSYVLKHLYADDDDELFRDVVSDGIDDFSELVLKVLSIANELMLDRLSQICQNLLGQFVTTRNISLLLNEISPCAVTMFKDAGLEYVCLQLEAMLENHLLDNLDDDLIHELDDVVRDNQLARYPFARSGRAESLLVEKYPELALDVDEERQRRVKEMAFRAAQRDEGTKLSTSYKVRYGSLEDFPLSSPFHDKPRRKSRVGKNEPFSPDLRPKDSHGDLMFSMDDEESSEASSPFALPHRTLEPQARAELDRLPSLGESWRDDKGKGKAVEGTSYELVSSPPAPPLGRSGVPQPRASADRPVTPQSANTGSPWKSSPLPTARPGLREIMSEASPQSALSAGLEAQQAKETQPKTPQTKMSQKERKKQQSQAAAQATQATQPKPEKQPVWEKPADPKPAPWKVVASRQLNSLKDVMSEGPGPGPATQLPSQKHLSPTGDALSQRRTASPDTRFSGQARTSRSAPTAPAPGRPRPAEAETRSQPPPLVPHSKSYIARPPKAEPVLGLSMTDIIGQQRREQQSAREAVAKRSLQEIQQEQEFQEWWDQESRRTQEEEARRVAREEREARKGTRGRGRKGRSGGAGGDGAEQGESAAASLSSSAPEPSHGGRGRGRGRGGKQ